MKHLMYYTQKFFEDTTPDGAGFWARVRDNIVIVLATPNAWGIREQATLRNAAVMASLVTEQNAGQLLQFVTEAEASAHYVLARHPGDWLRKKTVFVVVDCGRSTIETAVYCCESINPLILKETCPSESIQVLQFPPLLHLYEHECRRTDMSMMQEAISLIAMWRGC